MYSETWEHRDYRHGGKHSQDVFTYSAILDYTPIHLVNTKQKPDTELMIVSLASPVVTLPTDIFIAFNNWPLPQFWLVCTATTPFSTTSRTEKHHLLYQISNVAMIRRCCCAMSRKSIINIDYHGVTSMSPVCHQMSTPHGEMSAIVLRGLQKYVFLYFIIFFLAR